MSLHCLVECECQKTGVNLKYVLLLMTNDKAVEFIINKYHTGVDQFWLNDWQTDAISNWLTADHVRHIAATSNIFVTAVVYSR